MYQTQTQGAPTSDMKKFHITILPGIFQDMTVNVNSKLYSFSMENKTSNNKKTHVATLQIHLNTQWPRPSKCEVNVTLFCKQYSTLDNAGMGNKFRIR